MHFSFLIKKKNYKRIVLAIIKQPSQFKGMKNRLNRC